MEKKNFVHIQQQFHKFIFHVIVNPFDVFIRVIHSVVRLVER